jgi:hypothetical protein
MYVLGLLGRVTLLGLGKLGGNQSHQKMFFPVFVKIITKKFL